MRGVAGIAFVFLGLVMGYFILSGKFPSSSPIAAGPPLGTPGNEVPTPTTSNSFVVGGTQHAPGHGPVGDGGSSFGLPTMVHMNDLASSLGGMK